MSNYFDHNKDIFKNAAIASEYVVADWKSTSGEATGFFETEGTTYIKCLPETSPLYRIWGFKLLELPETYNPKPSEIKLAQRGSCPIPSYPDLNYPSNGIIYTNDTSLSETIYFFLAKNPNTKCLRYFKLTETEITTTYDTDDKRKAFFAPNDPEKRENSWKDINNTEYVEAIIIHLIGPGGDGGQIYSGGKAAGGGSSGPACSMIYKLRGSSDTNYEVFKITPEKTCWFSAEEMGSANFDPVESDEDEGSTWTKLVKQAKKGADGFVSSTNAPYSNGGETDPYAPTVWATDSTSWGAKFDKTNCVRLEPARAGQSGYDAGDDYKGESSEVSQISLGYAGIYAPAEVDIPEKYRTQGSSSYGYAGNGGIPAIHRRRRQKSDWPDLGVGGRGAYYNSSGEKISATNGNIGGVIIEYESI